MRPIDRPDISERGAEAAKYDGHSVTTRLGNVDLRDEVTRVCSVLQQVGAAFPIEESAGPRELSLEDPGQTIGASGSPRARSSSARFTGPSHGPISSATCATSARDETTQW